ncbi:MAG TPA: NAD(P)/FAD-dependent oxidoreductase [Nocardioidaceae bacterium]|nr:NAD(P)/FAD-dependent oxidoreductase [Nocardioidaceae bacterium]
MEEFEVVVIGGGPAGENAAGRCADGGLRVALVERELVGGECSYWGCVPSKTLIRPGDALAAARRVPGAAAAVVNGVDVAAALARRDEMTGAWHDDGALPWLHEKGIALVRGDARITGEREVTVEAPAGARVLRATRAVVLAVGTSAVVPPVDGLREISPWDNRAATSAKEVPRRLLVLGGGAIGVELAQAFRRLGAEQVTLVEGQDRLLAREEPFVGAELRRALEAEGVTVLTGARLARARRPGPGGPVLATLEDGREVESDEVLVAVGRRPATGALGLESVGLAPGRYVDVDDAMQARGVPGGWLYAIGDCNGRALLTHMGKYHGRIAGDVILGRDVRDRASDRAVPRVTFTDPQVCAVGLTEEQAGERGLRVRTVTYGTGDVAGSSVQGLGLTGTAKLVVDEGRRVVVGATFTGPGLQELLHSATVAVVGEIPLDTLWHAVPSFPTVSEVWLRLLESYGL